MDAKNDDEKTLYTIEYIMTWNFTKSDKVWKVIEDAHQTFQSSKVTSETNFDLNSQFTENKNLFENTEDECAHDFKIKENNLLTSNPDAMSEIFSKKQKWQKSNKKAKKKLFQKRKKRDKPRQYWTKN